MKLELSQIKEITLGAVKVAQQEDGISFHRFTAQQEEMFKERRDDFYHKTFCTAGVQLRFRTDSKSLGLKVAFFHEAARNYFAMDLFVDGKMLDSLNNYDNMELPRLYTGLDYPELEFEKTYTLPEGEKEIRMYLPWSARVVLKELSLDDGAWVKPVKPGKKLLCFGDSITQGYDLLHPSCRYAAHIADFLGAEEHNKAIGGDVFFPELAQTREDFDPDYIIVAFGTNDWYRCGREETETNCRAFYQNISATYPGAKIFAFTPIWRADLTEERPFGDFFDVEKMIAAAVADLNNVTLVRGFDFVPHDTELYADGRLHPNDEGGMQYFQNLAKQLKAIL